MKSCNFYCKRHTLAWIHAVWAILREGPLGIWQLEPRSKKVRKSRTPIGRCVVVNTGLALPRSLWLLTLTTYTSSPFQLPIHNVMFVTYHRVSAINFLLHSVILILITPQIHLILSLIYVYSTFVTIYQYRVYSELRPQPTRRTGNWLATSWIPGLPTRVGN